MAHADTASASVRSDSIKGLAQSIAKPAYQRLVSAEPLLRRAVPVLIVAFLGLICVGAVVQVIDFRRQTEVRARSLHAPCGWSAFEGWPAIFPREHYLDGHRIVSDGEYIGDHEGRVLRPEFAPRESGASV